MNTTGIIQKIHKEVIGNVNRILQPWIHEHDIRLMMDILHGKSFKEGKIQMSVEIGSGRRLNRKSDFVKPEPVFYDEIKIVMDASANCFSFSAFIFYNQQNKTEGFNYLLNTDLEIDDVFSETIMLPEGNNGRKPELFFHDLTKLLELNRDIRIQSTLHPLANKVL